MATDLGLGNGGESAAWWPRLPAGNRESRIRDWGMEGGPQPGGRGYLRTIGNRGFGIGEWREVCSLVAAATWGNRECLSPFSECISPLSCPGPGDRTEFRTMSPPTGSRPTSLHGAAPERVWFSSAKGWQRGLAGGGVRTFCCGWSRRTSERPGEDVVDPITRRGGRKVAPLLLAPVQQAAGTVSGAASTAFNTSSAE